MNEVYGITKEGIIQLLLDYNSFIVKKTGDLTIEELANEDELNFLIRLWTENFFKLMVTSHGIEVDDIMTHLNEDIRKIKGVSVDEYINIMESEIN